MKKFFFVLLGYQLTWFFCVFGEYYDESLSGLVVGFIYLSFFFYFITNKLKALKIWFIISVIGYTFDSCLGFIEVFKIKSNIIVGYLPIWFLILWPSFSTLFVDVLSFLKNRPILAFLLGSTFAPSTYYLGIPLGIAQSNNIFLALTIMIIFWGMLLMLCSFFLYNENNN